MTNLNQELADAYARSKVSIWSGDCRLVARPAHQLEVADSKFFLSKFGARTLFVITAWNPESLEVSVEANAKANKELLIELENLDCEVLEALGSSLDDSWFEDSFALVVGDQEIMHEVEKRIRDLALKYRQNAYFKITPETIEIVGALFEGLHLSLPLALEVMQP